MLGAGAGGTRPPAAARALRQMRAEQLSPRPAPGNASEHGAGEKPASSRARGAGGCGAKVWGGRWERAGAGRAR